MSDAVKGFKIGDRQASSHSGEKENPSSPRDPDSGFQPATIQGEPLSETILRERK